ncbi:hypothetical protein [Streptomyces sp. NPDC093808]|uniref:hypothetical protein n=1 Tax=Streptomyces sp. NPDC093808 TaxID=3154985 RepID=UPI003450629E
MCYAEFGGIVQAIDDLDADVISLEAARSPHAGLPRTRRPRPPARGRTGVYDILSPRTPSTDEAADLLRTGLKAVPVERLWVNPDRRPKTRS